MYLSDLLEDESAQVSGLKFYPDPTSQSHYIVRRAGTMQHLKFKAKLANSSKYPPEELLSAEQRQEQKIEMLRDEVRDYLLVDMIGFLDENDQPVNYKKQKAQIISGDSALRIINDVLTFANSQDEWGKTKNLALKKKLEEYIKVNIMEEADNNDWLAYYETVGADAYHEKRGNLTSQQSAILHCYFDLKRDARGELVTRKQACEGALYVDYDFNDCVDIILHIDDFYTRCQNEKMAKQAKAKQ